MMEDEGRSRNHNEELQENITSSWNRRSDFRKVETPSRSFSTRYENIFLGHFYVCRNFEHKSTHCKSYEINNYMRRRNDYGYPKDNLVNNRYGYVQVIVNRNYNQFDPLMDQNIVCYK